MPADIDALASELAASLLQMTGGDADASSRLAAKTRYLGPPPRVAGFGDLDFEHGSRGPFLGSDQNDMDGEADHGHLRSNGSPGTGCRGRSWQCPGC